MTDARVGDALVIETADERAYAIPWTVVEAGRIPPERAEHLVATIAQGDVHGLGGRAILPYVGEDGSFYALSPDEIEGYRLAGNQAEAAHAALSEDVAGYLTLADKMAMYPAAVAQSAAPSPSSPSAGLGGITIINQYNINIGINLAINSPGAIMSIAQLGSNSVT